MKKYRGSIAAALMALSLVATPAQACWNNAEQDAARIANMNQMLMVSALRCRFGKQNFLSDYNRFIRFNNDVLASQHHLIKARYARTMGDKQHSLNWTASSLVCRTIMAEAMVTLTVPNWKSCRNNSLWDATTLTRLPKWLIALSAFPNRQLKPVRFQSRRGDREYHIKQSLY